MCGIMIDGRIAAAFQAPLIQPGAPAMAADATAAGSVLTPTVVEATVTLAAAEGAASSPLPGDWEIVDRADTDTDHDEPEAEGDLCNANADTIPGVPDAVVGDCLSSFPAESRPAVLAPAAADDTLERRVERLEARFSVLKRKAADHFGVLEKEIDGAYEVASVVNRKIVQLADYAQETRRVVKRLSAAAKLPAPQV